ncbi:MAG: hypothetical protein NXI16_12450 [Alphaproteobacteria bacterium]|nr:hypothetical protein [Alphaproteobacteria bacterium]
MSDTTPVLMPVSTPVSMNVAFLADWFAPVDRPIDLSGFELATSRFDPPTPDSPPVLLPSVPREIADAQDMRIPDLEPVVPVTDRGMLPDILVLYEDAQRQAAPDDHSISLVAELRPTELEPEFPNWPILDIDIGQTRLALSDDSSLDPADLPGLPVLMDGLAGERRPIEPVTDRSMLPDILNLFEQAQQQAVSQDDSISLVPILGPGGPLAPDSDGNALPTPGAHTLGDGRTSLTLPEGWSREPGDLTGLPVLMDAPVGPRQPIEPLSPGSDLVIPDGGVPLLGATELLTLDLG